MTIEKPYIRTCRQLSDGSYARSGNGAYVEDNRYAHMPQRFTRAFLLLQKDMLELCEYIEPADKNLGTYSYRTHELLLRACIEIEANCKSVLLENGYSKSPTDMTMRDYSLLEQSHRLSAYKVQLPHWEGKGSTFQPFSMWATGGSLPWYQAYNTTKHVRSEEFHQATFDAMLNAIGGLAALLWAQFRDNDFLSSQSFFALESSKESAIGGYFQIEPPDDWPVDQRYDFQWQALKNQADAFQKFEYDALPLPPSPPKRKR